MKNPFNKSSETTSERILPPSSYGRDDPFGLLDEPLRPTSSLPTPSWDRPNPPRRPIMDLPDSKPRSSYGSVSDTEIWGDSIEDTWQRIARDVRAESPTIMDRIREHKIAVGAALATAAIAPIAFLTLASDSSEESVKPTKNSSAVTVTTSTPDYASINGSEEDILNPPTTEVVVSADGYTDLDSDGKVSESEKSIQKELEQITKARELPPISSKPLKTRLEEQDAAIGEEPVGEAVEISGLVDEYEPKFVGGYESVTGMRLNIYAATQDGQEDLLEQDFKINPESIEYVLNIIEKNIENAPEGPTKDSIIQNFKDMRSGKDDRLYEVVFDMSDTPSCLSAEYQLIKFVEETCEIAGVTEITNYDGGDNVHIPIIITNGAEYVTTPAEKQPPADEFIDFDSMTDEEAEAYLDEYGSKSKLVTSTSEQTHIFAHELGGHGLSGYEGISQTPIADMNTYKEDGLRIDKEHKVVDWFMGDRLEDYDLDGVVESPNLGENIRLLTKAGILKPIIEVR